MSAHSLAKAIPKLTTATPDESRPSSQESVSRRSSSGGSSNSSSSKSTTKRTAEEVPAKNKRCRPSSSTDAESPTPKSAKKARPSEEDAAKPKTRAARAPEEVTTVRQAADSLRHELGRHQKTNVPSAKEIADTMKTMWWKDRNLPEDSEADMLPVRVIRTMHETLPALAKNALASKARLPTEEENKWFSEARTDFEKVVTTSAALVERLRKRLEAAEKDHEYAEAVLKELNDTAQSRGSMPDAEKLSAEAITIMRQYQEQLASAASITLSHLAPAPTPAVAAVAPIGVCAKHREVQFACEGCQEMVCPSCVPPRSDPSTPHLYKWDCPKCNRIEIGAKLMAVRSEPMDVVAPTTTTTTVATTASTTDAGDDSWTSRMVAQSPLTFLPGAAADLAALLRNDQGGNPISLDGDDDDEHTSFTKKYPAEDFCI